MQNRMQNIDDIPLHIPRHIPYRFIIILEEKNTEDVDNIFDMILSNF